MSVVIHLGGQIPSRQLAQRLASQAELLIAADKGYDSCRQNGLMPKIVTGDLDSIQALPSGEGVTIIPAMEQTATDFEKALRLVPDSTSRIDILGGTGLRSDHFLTNLLIAAQQPSPQAIVFHDDLQEIHRVTPECPYTGTPARDTIISLIPFSDCAGTNSSGLLWELVDTVMGPSRQLGQSNRVAAPSVSVSIRSGRLFVVVNQLQ